LSMTNTELEAGRAPDRRLPKYRIGMIDLPHAGNNDSPADDMERNVRSFSQAAQNALAR
jgi:hypothetical protein